MATNHEKFMREFNQLPSFCQSFFAAKADIYEVKTKTAYALDLKTFFWYMIDALADRYPYERISQIKLEDLRTIHEDDILNYMAYLSEYTMKDENGQYLTKTGRNGKQEIITYSNSPAGKARKLAALKSFFKYMNVHRGFNHNPAIYIDPPKIKKRPIVALSPSEEKKVLKEAQKGANKSTRAQKFHEKTRYRDHSILQTFLGTGIRISELAGLDLGDLDLEEMRLLVRRKGGAMDFVYFNKDVAEALLDYMELERPELLKNGKNPDEQAVYLSNRGSRLCVNRIEAIVKEYGKIALPANVKVTAHVLRKTFGTSLYNETGDVSLVQNALGHADSSTTTKFYIGFDPERLKKLRNRKR